MPGSKAGSGSGGVRLPSLTTRSKSAPQLHSKSRSGHSSSSTSKLAPGSKGREGRHKEKQARSVSRSLSPEDGEPIREAPERLLPDHKRRIVEVLTNPEIKTVAAKYFNAQLPDSREGRLGFSDLRRVLRSLNDRLGMPVSTSEAEQLFKRFDFDGSGSLTFSEFFELFVSSLRRVAFDRSTLLGRDLFVSKQHGKVWDNYEKSKKLGAGSFGAAYLAKHRRSGETRVVKAVEKSQVKLPVEDVEKEIMVMLEVDHPNICRLHEWYEGASTIYLVLDALRGGTLQQVVLQNFQRQGKPMKEDWIRSVMHQVLEAMAFCHSKRIIHKDLKDENIMLVNKDNKSFDDPFVVIIDLGVAELFPLADPHGKAMGGTPTTMAPEVWMGNFGPKCDVWSVGCVLFQLLAGDLPFLARSFNPKDWLALHKRGPKWDLVRTSDLGKRLCHSMLTFSDSERPSMEECLGHKWFEAKRGSLGAVSAEQLQPLQNFSEQTSLQRALLLELAARLPMSHAERVVKVFKSVDKNADGGMNRAELRDYFKQVGLKDDEMVNRTFQAMDADGNGTLSFSEFAAGVLLIFSDILEDRFRALFRRHDKDCDGVLTKEEAREFLANALHMASRETRRKPDEVFKEMFKDGVKTLSYEDLKLQILPTAK